MTNASLALAILDRESLALTDDLGVCILYCPINGDDMDLDAEYALQESEMKALR